MARSSTRLMPGKGAGGCLEGAGLALDFSHSRSRSICDFADGFHRIPARDWIKVNTFTWLVNSEIRKSGTMLLCGEDRFPPKISAPMAFGQFAVCIKQSECGAQFRELTSLTSDPDVR